ncbi:redoxin domain-containing protein [Candidatus Poribacteria bacterium]|nr:redoxin domain-containing protein [Candidatus Poribacteria bacterium]
MALTCGMRVSRCRRSRRSGTLDRTARTLRRCLNVLLLVGLSLRSAPSVWAQDPAPDDAWASGEVIEFGPDVDGADGQPVAPVTARFDAQAAAICREQLSQVGEGFRLYRLDHNGAWPELLSDMVPTYIADSTVLICPADEEGGDPVFRRDPEPRVKTSYAYEFAPSNYENARSVQRLYGAYAPVLRCWHHLALARGSDGLAHETVLGLDCGLRVVTSLPEWTEDSAVLDTILREVRTAVRRRDRYELVRSSFGVADLLSSDARDALLEQAESALTLGAGGARGGLLKLVGALRRAAKDQAGAREAYVEASQLLPDDAEVHFLAGVLLEASDQRDEAVKQFSRGLELQPDTVDVIRELGAIYAESGDTEGVQRIYGALQSVMRPRSFGYRVAMSDVSYAAGDLDAALDSSMWLLRAMPASTSLSHPLVRQMIDRIASIYEQRDQSDAARQLRTQIEPGTALIDSQAPPIAGRDQLGAEAAWEPATQPAILVFWESQSRSSERLLKAIAEALPELDSLGIDVVGVNRASDTSRELLFASVHAPFRHLYASSDAFRSYQIRSLPTCVYVDASGIVRYFDAGVTQKPSDHVRSRAASLVAPSVPSEFPAGTPEN